jgi:hypothetical protein
MKKEEEISPNFFGPKKKKKHLYVKEYIIKLYVKSGREGTEISKNMKKNYTGL